MTAQFSRQELYDLVWSEPISTLAKRLAISDVGLAKACKRADIPLPGLGYWAKVRAGKPTTLVSLPPRGFGKSDEIDIKSTHGSRTHTDDELLSHPLPPPPSFPDGLEVVTNRAKTIVGKTSMPHSLSSAHPLISKLLELDEQRREKARNSPYAWDAPVFDSPPELYRLRVLNGLILALVRVGCQPSLRGREARELGVTIGDQHLSFSLDFIQSKKQRGQNAQGSKESDAKLKLEISVWQPSPEIKLHWAETVELPFRDLLGEIVVGFLVASEWIYRKGLAHQYHWLQERKSELEEKARKAKAEAEHKERERDLALKLRRRNQLVADCHAWRQSAEIRAYVDAVLAKEKSQEDGASEERLAQWATWARAEADLIDPLMRPSAIFDL